MTEVFTEIRRTCPHCAGVGYAPRVYEHGLALDLLVDAEDCARFDGEEARRLYRLAAKYEDMAAEREHSLMPTPNAMTKLHRLNAIYLRRSLTRRRCRPYVGRPSDRALWWSERRTGSVSRSHWSR